MTIKKKTIASSTDRLLAFIIDYSFISVITVFELFLTILIFSPFSTDSPADVEVISDLFTNEAFMKSILYVIFIANLNYHFYFSIFHYISGKTIGKKLLKMKVIYEKNEKSLSAWTIFLREFIGKLFSGIVFGYIWLFFNNEKKEAWDYLSGTIVIKLNSSNEKTDEDI